MASKASERLKALQERAAALASPSVDEPDTNGATSDHDAAIMAASTHFGGALDQLVRERTIQSLPVQQIAPDTRPEMQQPRFLPLPEQLMLQSQPVPEYRDLVAELVALGESLRERQIQPIVVFPGTSDTHSEVRFLILVGQRRWTAARLIGLETLEAVVVDPPTPADRVLIQYAENEEREEFSDMERAWSLYQMKQALADAPWEQVETRLQMSRARRQQLLRLTAFTPAQQRVVALLRLQETQARTLHSALRAGELTEHQVDSILERLTHIATERGAVTTSPAASDAGADSVALRRWGIDGPTVARLVARARRAAALGEQAQTTPRWLPSLRDQTTRTSQSLQRALERVEMLGPTDAAALEQDLKHLHDLVEQVLRRIEGDE